MRTTILIACIAAVAGCSGSGTGSSNERMTLTCGAPANGALQGVDVAHFQGNFDWAGAGVAFGYASVGDGGFMDPMFDTNWANLKAAGVLRGAYQYFEPGEDEVAQANTVVAKVGHLGQGDLPAMIDVEVTGGQGPGTIAAKVRTWLQIVEAGTGKRPIIYTGAYFWEGNVGDTSFGAYPLWIAAYGVSCPKIPAGWSNWLIWQYSDGGGNLDHDVFNGSAGDLAALAGATSATPAKFQFFDGDFNGDGKSDELFYYEGDQNWWMGLSDGNTINWHLAGNTHGFVDPSSAAFKFFTGDYNGDGKTDILSYFSGDGNWWMGLSDGSNINWHFAGNTTGFGNMTGSAYSFFNGDFNGDGKADVLFYYAGDANWWMGLSDGNTVNWHLAGNTTSFVAPTSPAFHFITGDYNGDGKADLLAYFNGDSNWWMGLSDGSNINWHFAGNTAGFGNLLDGSKWFFDGDFNGDKKADVTFYSTDGNWWMGLSDGNTVNWHLAGNTTGFGNLLDGSYGLFEGDYNGDGKRDVLFYYRGDSNWWMGLSDGSAINWHLAGNTAGFGDLLDGSKRFFSGDYNGDGKRDVTFYFNGDSNWWMGLSDGSNVNWHLAGNTAGFGNLLQ